MVFEEQLKILPKSIISRIYIIILSILLIILFTQYSSNDLIYSEKIDWLNYTIKHHGIETKIQYPANWEIYRDKSGNPEYSEFRDYDEYLIYFYPSDNFIDFQLHIEKRISPFNLSSTIDKDLQKLKNNDDITIIESKPSNLSNNPAHEIVYFESDQKILVIKTIRDNIEYSLQYSAKYPSEYDRFYPIIQRIMKSFEIGTINMISYFNPIYGIDIEQYPSNWERDDYYDGFIRFILPESSQSNPMVDFHIEHLINNNDPLKIFIDKKVDQLKELRERFGKNINIIEIKNTTLFGYPATSILDRRCVDEEMINNTDFESKTICQQYNIVMQIWAIHNNIAYGILYDSNEKEYNEYLPILQKVLKHIKITPTYPTISSFIDNFSKQELSQFFNILNLNEVEKVLEIFYNEKTNDIKEKLDTKGRWEFSKKLEEIQNPGGSNFANMVRGGY